jgi:Domain of unknown function (DUF4232)
MTRSVGIPLAVGVMAVGLLTAACGSPRTSDASSNTSTTTSSSVTLTASTAANSDGSAPTDGSAGSGASAANRQCLTANLKVTVGGGDAGAGHSFLPIVFTNTGGACTIAAYPGVSYVAGDDGHQVGDPAIRVPGSMPAITLQPGQAASAALSMTNVGLYDAGECKPVAVRGLRVYPPNNTASAFVPLTGQQGCSGHVPNQEPMRIKPVVAGSHAQ